MDSQNSDIVKIILEAIKSRDINTIEEMLSKNPDIMKYSASSDPLKSYTLFWEAMTNGSEEIVKIFIKFGADVNELYKFQIKDSPNTYYENYLHWILKCKDWQSRTKTAEILIRHGANVNASSNLLSRTPIQCAIEADNVQCAEFLLKNGASLQDTKSMINSLSYRSRVCSKEMLLLLLQYNFDIKFCNQFGENLLHTFSKLHDERNSAVEVTKILLDAGISVNEIDEDGNSPLKNAIFYNNTITFVNYLIERGADVNKKFGEKKESLLLTAVKYENEDLVKLLAENGADVNALNSEGWTALHEACVRNKTDIIYFLLSKGAKVSVEDEYGDTPLLLYVEMEEHNLDEDDDEDEDDEYYNPLPGDLVDEIAREKFETSAVSEFDMELIQQYPEFKYRFEDCLKELSLMKETIFYAPYSFYSVIKMYPKIKKFAKLIKNEELEKKYKEKYHLFNNYIYILHNVYLEAVKIRDQSLIVDSRLNCIFGDFLPDIVKRKLADNLKVEDLPLE